MKWIMIDVEADGPCPGLYSMIELGAVYIECDVTTYKTFYGSLRPITNVWHGQALESIGRTRSEIMEFNDPKNTMELFYNWVHSIREEDPRIGFISDNNGFDWQFVNYYLWKYVGRNPFGHSSTNLNSLCKGFLNKPKRNIGRLRKTKHDHNPVNDCIGNVEALFKLIDRGLDWPLS